MPRLKLILQLKSIKMFETPKNNCHKPARARNQRLHFNRNKRWRQNFLIDFLKPVRVQNLRAQRVHTNVVGRPIFIYVSSFFIPFHLEDHGISSFTYTLKGIAWLPDEDASPVRSRQRICKNLSIISFLCHVGDSSSNILIGYPALSSLFSSSMGFFWVRHDRFGNCLIGLCPNFLYPDLVGDMHEQK
jgi:hypothetical protein